MQVDCSYLSQHICRAKSPIVIYKYINNKKKKKKKSTEKKQNKEKREEKEVREKHTIL